MNKLRTEKKIINKTNRDQDSYRVNRYILKIYEFDRGPPPISPSNSSFINSLFSILPPLTTETSSAAVTFNLTERPTATGALLKDTSQKISQPATASPTNEAIDNMLETVEYNSIRGYILGEIRKEIEEIISQKQKILLENSESLIKSAKETYAHQLKVPLNNFENDLTSPIKIDSETDPKSDEQQQSYDNKQQISSKKLSENSKEKDSTNSILVTDSVTIPNQNNKQQSHDDKQKSHSKKFMRIQQRRK